MAKAKATVRYRPIQGFPGYRVGDDGSVWSRWDRYGMGYGRGTCCYVGLTWRRLRTDPEPGGRLRVTLMPGRRRRFVHQLVLEAFVGPCPPGMEACHNPDRDPTNNRLGNLRWDTKRANYADAVRHGTRGALAR